MQRVQGDGSRQVPMVRQVVMREAGGDDERQVAMATAGRRATQRNEGWSQEKNSAVRDFKQSRNEAED